MCKFVSFVLAIHYISSDSPLYIAYENLAHHVILYFMLFYIKFVQSPINTALTLDFIYIIKCMRHTKTNIVNFLFLFPFQNLRNKFKRTIKILLNILNYTRVLGHTMPILPLKKKKNGKSVSATPLVEAQCPEQQGHNPHKQHILSFPITASPPHEHRRRLLR